MRFDEIDDPEGRAFDQGGNRYTGNGDVGLHVRSLDDLDYTMFLIKQSFAKHGEGLDS